MTPILAIARRELSSTLGRPGGWVVLSVWLLLSGLTWVALLDLFVGATHDAIASPYGGAALSLEDSLLTPWFRTMAFVLLLICPAIAMRLFAAEYSNKTWSLLAASPLSSGAILVGKYLGALGFLAVLLVSTLHLPTSLYVWASPDPGALAAGYLSLWLLGATVLALGALASSLTSSQVVALLITEGAALILWLVGRLDADPDSLPSWISLSPHVHQIMGGVVRGSDLVWFAGLIVVLLIATREQLDARRWR